LSMAGVEQLVDASHRVQCAAVAPLGILLRLQVRLQNRFTRTAAVSATRSRMAAGDEPTDVLRYHNSITRFRMKPPPTSGLTNRTGRAIENSAHTSQWSVGCLRANAFPNLNAAGPRPAGVPPPANSGRVRAAFYITHRHRSGARRGCVSATRAAAIRSSRASSPPRLSTSATWVSA
jgi:hypothetical protein